MLSTKELKFFIFLSISIVFFYALLSWSPFSSYYYSFAVTYNKYNYPFITTKLQGNPCTLRIDIGCRFPLFLDKKILDGLKKQPKGTQICRNIYGNQEEALHYLIPQLKLGDLVLKNATAYQTDEERHNSLGMFLGSQFNLLLDFTQDRIIACDSFSKLCNKKIADKISICPRNDFLKSFPISCLSD